MKLGELIGRATRDATLEALRWQNGLEVSYTRGVFHALGRFGVREATLFDDIAPFLERSRPGAAQEEQQGRVLRAARWRSGARAGRRRAIACATAHCRRRSLHDAMTQQAATLAANLAAQVHRWSEFRALLRPHATGDVKALRACERWPSAGRRSGARVIELVRALAPDPAALVVGCRGRPDRSAIRSIRAHPVRLIGAHAAVARRPAARASASMVTAAASCCSFCSRRCGSSAARRRSSRSRWPSRRRRPGSCTSCCSTRCSRSVICCTTSGASSQRCARTTSSGHARAVSALVGRDTDRMDGAGVPPGRRREPQREPDGRLREPASSGTCSRGLPGLVLFKVVSTMDSMVGYKTPQYLRFGWCGARLDDVMNYLPARLTWFVIALRRAHRARLLRPQGVAGRLGTARRAARDRTPGGARRRLPERSSDESSDRSGCDGVQVTDRWVGDPASPPLSEPGDVRRALILTTTVGMVVATLAGAIIWSQL